jgi:subtilisin-like proprotein convertase family protein
MYMTLRQIVFKTALMTMFLVQPLHAFAATSIGTFSNSSAITIIDNNAAAPYPSSIPVSGLSAPVESVRVSLFGVNHTWPEDIGVLLVGPLGQRLVLKDGAGYFQPIVNTNIIFDDGGIPLTSPIVSGTLYQPTNQTQSYFPAPAPSSPYSSTPLATFNNINPNGTWQLYIRDSGTGDGGSVSGGWQIEFFTLQTAHFEVTVPVGDLTTGTVFSITVTAKNPDNTTNTSYTGTVSFNSTDPVATLPAPYVFVPSDNGSHTFTGIVLNTTGIQTISASASGGVTGISNQITRVSPSPATSTAHPQDTTIISGFAATLNVAATGTSSLGYQWYQGVSPDTSALIPGATSNTYTTPALYGPANYWVRVSGSYGTPVDSNPAHVITVNKPAFSNINPITITDNSSASLYPSSIIVSNVIGNIDKVIVRLIGVAHTSPRDIGVLLVGPQGQKVVLMDSAGSDVFGIDASTDIIFDDNGIPFPVLSKIVSGTYRPTNQTDSFFPAPAPARPYSATPLSTFNNFDPNGIWQLYVRDSGTGGTGIITGGWQIEFQIPTYALTVNVAGTGSGTVTSIPQVSGSISCMKDSSANCTGSFASADLIALKSSDSIFSGWSQDCSGTSTCTFNPMNANRSVTATFNTTPPFFLYSAGIYATQSTLQDVYSAVPGNAVILMQSTIPAGGLIAASAPAKTVTIKGGYDADFAPNPSNTSFTTVQGKLELRNGTLNVQRVKVK